MWAVAPQGERGGPFFFYDTSRGDGPNMARCLYIAKIVLLAVVQGLAELLPVSSSAHVIVTEKLVGLDPKSPEMTLLLVMLHTGTMFAVIVYFWRAWKEGIFASREVFKQQAVRLVVATLLTAVGVPLIWESAGR